MLKKILKAILIIVMVASAYLLTSSFELFTAEVVGTSMLPTYEDGDYVLMTRRWSELSRGDVVVCWAEHDVLIKRVVGVPGDTIRVKDSKVIINDDIISEDYLEKDIIYNGGIAEEEILLGDDEYFVMGDNRGVSKDSRYFGVVKTENILGRRVLDLW